MPREIVGSEHGPFHVKVGWSREQEVQLGVEGDEGRSMVWLLYGSTPEELLALGRNVRVGAEDRGSCPDDEALGRHVLNVLDVLSGEARTAGDSVVEIVSRGYMGVWTDLDRSGCNRLIRTLRKARDDAFGRDE